MQMRTFQTFCFVHLSRLERFHLDEKMGHMVPPKKTSLVETKTKLLKKKHLNERNPFTNNFHKV